MKELENISDVNLLNRKLKQGGVIAFVTDTVWGLGCLPSNEAGVDKIYEIKGRDRSKPLILMSNNTENLLPYVKNLSSLAKELIQKYFPGALTLILEKSDKTPDFITSGKDTVGVRVPDNEFFKKLCSKIEGGVLATTSANLSNHPSSKSYEEAKNSIGAFVDFVFDDCGYNCKGKESTVVLIEENSYKVLRQGSVFID